MCKHPGLSLILFLLSYSVNAQMYSPYSRSGLGMRYEPVIGALRGMGGISTAYNSKVNINPANPASYSFINLATFEIGLNADGGRIQTATTQAQVMNGSLSHVALAFPVFKDRWTVVAGLLPYSRVQYGFTQNVVDTPLNTSIQKFFTGDGSTYNFFVGNGLRYGPISVGANLGVVFGKYNYDRYLNIPDSVTALNARNSTEVRFRSFQYQIGIQYHQAVVKRQEMQKTIYLTAGVTFAGGQSMQIHRAEWWQRFVNVTYQTSTFQNVIDTPSVVSDQDDKMRQPVQISGGLMIGNELFWQLGVDFRWGQWSAFRTPLENGQLNDAWRFSFGAQLLPDHDARRNLLKRTQYKAGFYYGQSEFMVRGESVRELGGTVGFAFPLRSFARFNIAGDFGTRGPATASALRETYYRIHFGITINDVWFLKRKYD